MKHIFDIIKVKLLLRKFDKTISYKDITYDWDGGHCYSSIENPVWTELYNLDGEISQDLFHLIEDHCYKWLYDNDECPPCQIYVEYGEDGKVIDCGSSCGCHDHYDLDQDQEYINDQIEMLKSYDEEHNYGLKYLVTVGKFRQKK
jgi:hypothetical protein